MKRIGLEQLGAIPVEGGVKFAVQAMGAQAVSLLLFRTTLATRATRRHELTPTENGIWECFVEGARIGDLYAYSVQGPRDGRMDDRLDPHALLLDPWAIEIGRLPRWELDVEPPFVAPPLARVSDRRFDWGGVAKPLVDPARRVIYEAHVKGLTKLHPGIPEKSRGTYAGICHPVVIDHLKALGVTTLELLPVHAHMDDRFLVERGLVNFWGYSTLSWFAPHPSYASVPERSLDEFRTMVRQLHRAGIEVVLDVVYNHSCEAGVDGPDLSLRGFGSWYLRHPDGSMRDLTGCGNTLDFSNPSVRTFVLQSLRHWAEHCQIDGFRFDLASVHARGQHGFDPTAPFFQEMSSDPVLGGCLRIAEPWDATSEGYGLGRYPEPWLEWNDRFRDDVRLFWKGEGSARKFALRLAGSPDIFVDRPVGSAVNYVACHDGFTLRDLVTWSQKRNDANGEDNQDGSGWNHSDNLGVEGETSDPQVLDRRARRMRNLLASALLAQGTPMLLAGDELGRTQEGNNNAYCQDNPISWVRWIEAEDWPRASWVGQLLSLRAEFPVPGGWDWMGDPDDHAAAIGIVCTSGDRSRILVANRGASRCRMELPPGAWRLRFDSGSPSGVEDAKWSDPWLDIEPCTFLVLDSSHDGLPSNPVADDPNPA